MRRWWVLIGLLLSLGVNVGVLATLGMQHFRGEPQPRPPEQAPPPEAGRPNLTALADRLGVAGDARRRFLAAQEEFVGRMREQRFRLMQLQAELRAELVAERPDRERVEAITRQLGDTYAAQDRALAESILSSRDVLTPQQQQRFLSFVEARLHQLRVGDRPPRRPERPRFWPFRRRFDRPEPPPGPPS